MSRYSAAGVGFKVTVMFLGLFGIFYLMNQLRQDKILSPAGKDSALSMLFGADVGRPLNWCPADVQRLQVQAAVPEQTVTDNTQIQSYCQVLTEAFDSSQVNLKSFKPIVKAIGASGKEFVLEADSSGKIFRFEGLPFGSKQLSRQLGDKIQR